MSRLRTTMVCVLVWTAIGASLAGVVTAGGCSSTPPPFTEQLRARTFDRYWEELDENYPFFDGAGPERRGVDWNEIREQYRPRAIAAQHSDEFYHVLVGMLSELDDPHVSIRRPPERPDEPYWTSPGLYSRAMVDRGWYITSWGNNPPADPPASFTGREFVYPRLLRIDGQRPSLTLVDDLLVGRPGTDVDVELEWPDGSVTSHIMQRPVPDPPPPEVEGTDTSWARDPDFLRQLSRAMLGSPVIVRRFGDIGYLRVDTFDSDDALMKQSEYTEVLDEAINDLVDCRGVILDLRNNPGGEARIMSDFVGRFTDHEVSMGTIRLPVLWIFPVTFEWSVRPREPYCGARLAILTRPLTGSSAEHAAKLLRERGDCVIIGSRTAGAEAAVETVKGPDGSVMNYGRRRITDSSGHGLQFVGVEPDVKIEMTRDLLQSMGAGAAGRELQRRRFFAALEALDATDLWPQLQSELPELSGRPAPPPAPELEQLLAKPEQLRPKPPIRTR